MPHIRTLNGEKIEDWSFRRADTQYLTHGFHPYPARMIPQIARRIIERFSKSENVVLDPFCGSGSVLLEAKLRKRESIGLDINPLAVAIAKARTTLLDLKELDDESTSLRASIRDNSAIGNGELPIPRFPNISHWFKEKVIRDLAVIRKNIERIPQDPIRTFFEICFSSTLREVSNIAHADNPYFIRAMTGDKLRQHNPNTFTKFNMKVSEATMAMRKLVSYCKDRGIDGFQPEILFGDSRELLDKIGPVDAVVTSPPYGEEKNTMSYFRFAKLSCYWLWNTPSELKEYEKLSLGFDRRVTASTELRSPTLLDVLGRLAKRSPKRKEEVFAFFRDYNDVLSKLYVCLKEGGHCCIVIGNRTADKLPVLNDQITRELSEEMGFSYKKSYYREIPSKVLPRHDGRVSLINRESIVVLQK